MDYNQKQNKNKKNINALVRAPLPNKNAAPKINTQPLVSAQATRAKEIVHMEPRVKIVEKKKEHKSRAGPVSAAETLCRADPYLGAICDPFHMHGVRVPDLDTTPSSTFTIWDHRQITANANNIAAICLGNVLPTSLPGSVAGSLLPVQNATGTLGYAVGCFVSNAGASSSQIFYSAAANFCTNYSLPQWSTTASTVPSLYSQARLVSVGMRIVYTGNLLNAQGTLTLVSAPRNWLRDVKWDTNLPITLADLQAHPSAEIISIPEKFGGCVIWKPIDTLSTAYTDLNYRQAIDNFQPQCLGGEIYGVVSGAVAGSAYQVDICWNFEGVPQTNQFDLVNTSVSKSDPISMSNTMNMVEEIPCCLPLEAGFKSSTQSPQFEDLSEADTGKLVSQDHPAQEKTIIEKVLGGMDDVGKVVSKGIDMVGKVSPFLAAIL